MLINCECRRPTTVSPCGPEMITDSWYVPLNSLRLFNQVAFQEDRLFQGAEELLVGNGVLNGTKVKLSTGPYNELRIVALADGDCEADQIAAMIERAPCPVIAVEDE